MNSQKMGEEEHKEKVYQIRRVIAPIARLLDAPEELPEFVKILTEFQKTLALYKPMSEESEIDRITKIEELISNILNEKIDVLNAIPTAKKDEQRLSMWRNYTKSPHYCIYWHDCIYEDFEPQFQALRASLLPVLVKLQEAKSQDSKDAEKTLYKLGLTIRKLAKLEEEGDARILARLPTEATSPNHLSTQLEQLLPNQPWSVVLHKNYAHIYRALEWFQTGVWKYYRDKTTNRSRTRETGGGRGRISEIQEERFFYQDQGSSVQTRTFYAHQGERLAVDKKDMDADPLQDSGTVSEMTKIPVQKGTAFNAVDRAVVARNRVRYVAQAIEMGNQRLPITYATLTGFELKVLIEALKNPEDEAWSNIDHPSRDKVAAWGACRFFLGRGPHELMNIRIMTSGNAKKDLEITTWYPDTGNIWLPCELPLHKAPEDVSRVFCPSPGFMLDVSDTLGPFLRKEMKRSNKRLKIFKENLDDKFNQLINALNRIYGTALTINRVSNVIPGLVAQLAPNDEVMSVYFSGRKPNQHNPSVYSVVPVSRLQSLFTSACRRVYEQAQGALNPTKTSNLPGLVSSDDEFVGSFHVPTIKTLKQTIKDLIEKIERLKVASGVSLHEIHNAYTAYVLLFLMATTATRAVSQPIPFIFNIDKATGCCFVSEKDADNYRNARLIWLHPLVIEQLEEYERHVTRLRQHFALVNVSDLDKLDARNEIFRLNSAKAPNRGNDLKIIKDKLPLLFMMSAYGGSTIKIEPKRIEDLLGESWNLRLVSLRHFIRSELMFVGCSGVVINALLGHAERGELPWGKFSTLPPILWRNQLKQHLQPILDQLHFKVMKSPLLHS